MAAVGASPQYPSPSVRREAGMKSVMIADAAERIDDQIAPCATAITSTTGNHGTTPYASENATNSSDATISIRRRPIRSATVPMTGAANADANVYTARNIPAAALLPPSSMMRSGMTGSS